MSSNCSAEPHRLSELLQHLPTASLCSYLSSECTGDFVDVSDPVGSSSIATEDLDAEDSRPSTDAF